MISIKAFNRHYCKRYSKDFNKKFFLYQLIDPESAIAKVGIGKAEDVMADDTNRRAHTSARKVRNKDSNFANARPQILSTHNGITKGEMKDIVAQKVRDLRNQGHALPHNMENDKRYKPGYKK